MHTQTSVIYSAKRCEISGDSFSYQGRLPFAESLFNPLIRLIVALALIAKWARWQNIVRRISTAQRSWNEMILLQNTGIVPQHRRVTAIGASALEKGQSTFPVGVSETRGKKALCGPMALRFSPGLLWICLSPASLRNFLLFRMCKISQSRTLAIPFAMPLIFLTVVSIVLFAMPLTMAFIVLPFFLGMLFKIGANARHLFLWIGVIVPMIIGAGAFFAVRSQAYPLLAPSGSKIYCGAQKPSVALGAILLGNWLVDHSVSLSLYLKQMPEDGENCRFVGLQSLSGIKDYNRKVDCPQ